MVWAEKVIGRAITSGLCRAAAKMVRENPLEKKKGWYCNAPAVTQAAPNSTCKMRRRSRGARYRLIVVVPRAGAEVTTIGAAAMGSSGSATAHPSDCPAHRPWPPALLDRLRTYRPIRVDTVTVMATAKVLTVSESVHAGTREDRSGEALAVLLGERGFAVIERRAVPDGIAPVSEALQALAGPLGQFNGLVVTTGGTGFSPNDLTPEATRSVIEREAPGLAEAMRAVSPLGRLSRAVAGTLGACLIVNVPGSTAGAVETLDAVLDVVPHALDLLAGGRPH